MTEFNAFNLAEATIKTYCGKPIAELTRPEMMDCIDSLWDALEMAEQRAEAMSRMYDAVRGRK